MDAPLICWIDAEPIPQPRPHEGVIKNTGRIFRYVPKEHPVHQYRDRIRKAATEAHAGPPLVGPISIDIVAVFPRTKAMIWKNKPMPREWKSTKPDVDNLEKSIWDALKGVWWKDDAQIADSRCRKLYGGGHETPHVIVRVAPIVAAEETLFDGQEVPHV